MGFRLAVKPPERTPENVEPLKGLLTLEATKWQFTNGVRDAQAISPDNWNQNDVIFPAEGAHPYKRDLWSVSSPHPGDSLVRIVVAKLVHMKSRLTLVAVLLSIAAALAVGSSPSLAENTSDAERATAVEAMYQDYRSDFEDVPDVTPEALLEWMEDPKTVLVDVRKQKERVVSIIPGAISREEYEAHKEQYEGYRVISYCTIGYRSGKYSERLRKDGVDAYNLMAGILGWVHAGGAIEIDGEPTHEVHVYGRQWSLLPSDHEPVW